MRVATSPVPPIPRNASKYKQKDRHATYQITPIHAQRTLHCPNYPPQQRSDHTFPISFHAMLIMPFPMPCFKRPFQLMHMPSSSSVLFPGSSSE